MIEWSFSDVTGVFCQFLLIKNSFRRRQRPCVLTINDRVDLLVRTVWYEVRTYHTCYCDNAKTQLYLCL